MSVEIATVSSHPVSYDPDHQWYQVTNSFEYAYEDATSTNYLNIYMTRNNGAMTWVYFNFDFSSIPDDATITSVSCQAKAYISNTNSSRVTTRICQLYAGSTAKGSAHTLTTSTTAFSMTTGTWTVAELKQAKIYLLAIRGTSQTTTNIYLRFYGATFTVTYEYGGQEITIPIRVKSGGQWVTPTQTFIKQNGSWVGPKKIYIKDSGIWKSLIE